MAARETGFGAVEAYMHQGKLLALDLIVRVRSLMLMRPYAMNACQSTGRHWAAGHPLSHISLR